MRVFITGATGLIGRRLVPYLIYKKHDVVVVTRNTDRASNVLGNLSLEIIEADITRQGDWQEVASKSDAVVHLAGAGIMDRRWTKSYKKMLAKSRIDSTKNIAKVVNKILVCASATGIYGDCGSQELTEKSEGASTFLAKICEKWEEAARCCKGRVVHLRFGMVLDKNGGALAKMLPIFNSGIGGSIGNGQQYWPWISWQDACSVVHESVIHNWEGAINVVAPEQITSKEFATVLGSVLRRPAILKTPALALRLLLGEGSSVITSSQRVCPSKLIGSGFKFQYQTLRECLENILLGTRIK
tara:strand:+ start:89 stop:988 length:900 start_codon:yes stop_codon:yes gene_type:complete